MFGKKQRFSKKELEEFTKQQKQSQEAKAKLQGKLTNPPAPVTHPSHFSYSVSSHSTGYATDWKKSWSVLSKNPSYADLVELARLASSETTITYPHYSTNTWTIVNTGDLVEEYWYDTRSVRRLTPQIAPEVAPVIYVGL